MKKVKKKLKLNLQNMSASKRESLKRIGKKDIQISDIYSPTIEQMSMNLKLKKKPLSPSIKSPRE